MGMFELNSNEQLQILHKIHKNFPVSGTLIEVHVL